MFSVCAGLPGQGLIIIAQYTALSFYQDEHSKRCSSGQLPEATAGIQILLLVRLELVVGTLAPQGGRIYVFVLIKQKRIFLFVSSGCKGRILWDKLTPSFLSSINCPHVFNFPPDSHYYHIQTWAIFDHISMFLS